MPKNLSAWMDLCVHLIVIGILVMVLSSYNFYLGIIGSVVWLIMVFFAKERCDDRKRRFEDYCYKVIRNVNAFSNYAIEGLPQAILIVDSEGSLQWSNEALTRYWGVTPEQGMNVKDYWPTLILEPIWGTSGEYVFQNKDKHFRVEYRPVVPEAADESLMVFFATDITEYESLRIAHTESRTVLAYIQIDNYDEVRQGISEVERTAIFFEVNRILVDWVHGFGGFIRRVGVDLYIAVLDRKALEQAIAEKFDILDKIRAVRSDNKLPVTLSIGVASVENQSLAELGMQVQAGLDLALGRGGDQVAVSLEGKTQFYGGKTSAVEKHTRVKARVVAHALRELIEVADEVIVMGHHNEDFDAFGAAMGVAKMARHFSKPVRIVLSEMNDGIDKFKEMLVGKEEYSRLLVKAGDVAEITTSNPLLVVVDTHIPHLVACPELLNKISKIVVIDHHRRSEHIISNPLLLYIEPASSSTCELVTELLMYYSENLTITRIDATALYSGILVDTKNFAVQTGVRTFDAAAYLRRSGADPVLVRHLFKTDYETNVSIAKAKANSELFEGGLIVAVCPDSTTNAQVIAAQVADSLLRIENVNMSIVLFMLPNNVVGISARSSGEYNVQVVMEKFGGGGHQNVAGAQIKDAVIEDVRAEVIEIAKKHIEGND